MTKIQNGNLINETKQQLQTQGMDFPSELNDKVSVVYPLNMPTNILKYAERTSSGSVTMYTTPADKDFYMTYAMLNISKDVASDVAAALFTCYMEGAATRVFLLTTQPSTAESRHICVSFPIPIKIDRNTAIAVTATRTAGAHTVSGVVGGFIR